MPKKYIKKNRKKIYPGTKRAVRTKPFKSTLLKNRTSVPVGLGFPKRMVMSHRYCENFLQGTIVGALTTYQISCNGMFDPDTGTSGGVTHQPMYFDQMSALYDHYTVIGSKFTITISPQNNAFGPGIVGIYQDDDTTITPVTVAACMEQSTARYKFIAAGSDQCVRFTNKWSAKKTFGGSILGNDNLQGTSAANPTEQTYFTIFVASSDPGAADFDVAVSCTVTYIAVWDELKNLVQS